MRTPVRMTAADALRAKDMLWNGLNQYEVAEALGLSQPTISRLMSGKVWAEVEWPDGSTGAIPKRRLLQLTAQTKTKKVKPIQTVSTPQVNEDIDERAAIERAKAKASPEQKAQIRDALKKELEQAEDIMENEFEHKMTTILGSRPEPKKVANDRKPIEFDYMPWDEVVDQAPDNKIVNVVMNSEDGLLKKAVGVVFKALPRQDWSTAKAQTLVNEVYMRIRGEEE